MTLLISRFRCGLRRRKGWSTFTKTTALTNQRPQQAMYGLCSLLCCVWSSGVCMLDSYITIVRSPFLCPTVCSLVLTLSLFLFSSLLFFSISLFLSLLVASLSCPMLSSSLIELTVSEETTYADTPCIPTFLDGHYILWVLFIVFKLVR